MLTRSQDSPATEFSNALVPGKKASKAGRSDCLLIFLYGNSGDSNRIFSNVFFTYMYPASSRFLQRQTIHVTMQKKFNIAGHYRLAYYRNR